MAKDTAVEDFLANVGSGAVETVPFKPQKADLTIEGSEAIPQELADALEGVLETTIEKRSKQQWYTIYDKYGIPSKVNADRLQAVLREANPKTGERYFFSRKPATAPPLVTVVCPVPICRKTLSENPWAMNGGMPVDDSEDEKWRQDGLLFPHMYRRHRTQVPRYFRDEKRREELYRYAVEGR